MVRRRSSEGFVGRDTELNVLVGCVDALVADDRSRPTVAPDPGRSSEIGGAVGGVRSGAQTDPARYHNLVANPEITVEYGTESFDAVVEEMPEAEGQAKLSAQAALMPQFGEYIESAAPRVIPAFRITRR